MIKNNFHETLWSCTHCDSWYLCQDTERADTWRLINLSSIDEIPQELWNCQVWRTCGVDPSVCPKCGSKLHQVCVMKQDREQSVHFVN